MRVRSPRQQRGTTVVEFAIIGLLIFVVIFASIEFGRAMYTYNLVTEATRRGARVAAICPINHGAVRDAVLFNGSGSAPPGMDTGNITVEYLTAAGGTTASYPTIAYVRVGIADYELPLTIPGFDISLTLPPFSTTIPAESLGYRPDSDTRAC